GTLYYMSPEQIRGLGQVDARGDIYSAGMALYECLTGRVPFKAEDSDFAVAQMIVEGKIPPPEKLNASIPKELAKIVVKSIDKDPAKRYQTAAEMVSALERFEGTIRGAEYRMSEAPTIIGAPGAGPLTKPKPAAAQANLKLYGIIGGAVVVLIVTYFLIRPSVFPDEGKLSVQAVPESGRVFVDNQEAKSPVSDLALPPGKHHVIVTWGKLQRDSSFTVEAGKAVSLRMVQPAVAVRQTVPEEPAKQNPPPGPTGEKKEPVISTTTPEHVADAELTLEAVPAGEVSVDNGPWRNAKDGVHISVRPGQHDIVFRSGGVTKTDVLNARAGVADGRKCYFQGVVNVTSILNKQSVWASIVVDGVTREEVTPKAIPLPAGKHRIAVVRGGYASSPEYFAVDIAPSLVQPTEIPAKFELRKK
ncbi:MAG TPA: hypothetical protein VMM80_06720, partial [Bacteroidota bacterium]|nr:hypothetical protein [Bacteroidota bacterium]